MVSFDPGLVGILVAVVGWVAMLVASTSILVGLSVGALDLIYLGAKQEIMGEW